MGSWNEMPNAIYIQHATNLNRQIMRAHEETGGFTGETATKDRVSKAAQWMCQHQRQCLVKSLAGRHQIARPHGQHFSRAGGQSLSQALRPVHGCHTICVEER